MLWNHTRLRSLAAWLGLCASTTLAADALPPIDDVVQVEARVSASQQIQLDWTIQPDYFVFQQKIRLHSQTEGIELGSLKLPEAETIKDDFFGEHSVYRNKLHISAPMARENQNPSPLKFSLQYQVCQSFSQCYPQHSQSFELGLGENKQEQESAPETAVTPVSTVADPLSQYAEPEYLMVEEAFRYSTEVDEQQRRVYVRWKIADGYYLYQNKLHFKLSQGKGKIKDILLPKALLKQDDYFGEVMVYPQDFSVSLDIDSPEKDLTLQVNYQGCAAGAICYPPQTIELPITLPAITGTTEAASNATQSEADFLKSLDNLGEDTAFNSMTQGMDDFLEVDQAFELTQTGKNDTINLTWTIADAYYLYKDRFIFEWVSNKPQPDELKPNLPKGKEKDDPYFGLIEIYQKSISIDVDLSAYREQTGVLVVGYQGCAEAGLCYPPEKKFFSVDNGVISQLAAMPGEIPASKAPAPAVSSDSSMSRANNNEPLSEEQDIAKMLQDQNMLMVLAIFFGMGLLLSLTPCIFPMIPILSSIIVGQNKGDMTPRQGFIISLVYVLSMALTYSVAGVLAAILGENLQAALQNPWAISTFVLIFVALSLSMFGFYELQLPSSLQNKVTQLSNKQKSGDLIGVSIMGFLSALIVGPCVAPPLAGALLYIGQTGDVVLGGLSLFLLSIGMGIPLLIIGASAGKMLPRAGGWMDNVKYVFGVLLLATGIWMLERIAPAWLTMFLYASLLIISAVYLGALETLDKAASGWRKLWKGLGVILLIYGTIILIGMASGGRNVFQPLPKPVISAQGGAVAAAEEPLFTLIKGTDGLDTALTEANAQQKWLMLDFYADWCVTCKEWEHITFADPSVRAAMSDMIKVQADVTANDDLDKGLLKRYKISGPPAILFFDPKTGQERRGFRLTGFKDVEFFLAHLERLRSQP